MKALTVKFFTEELKYLSLALNNPLTIEQPLLFKNSYFSKAQVEPAMPAKVLALCAKSLVEEFAIRVMNKYNSAYQRGAKRVNIDISKSELLALDLCNRFGGFSHFGDYEHNLLNPFLIKGNQLTLN